MQSADDKKSTAFRVRLSEADREALKRRADAAGITPSEFIRKCIHSDGLVNTVLEIPSEFIDYMLFHMALVQRDKEYSDEDRVNALKRAKWLRHKLRMTWANRAANGDLL